MVSFHSGKPSGMTGSEFSSCLRDGSMNNQGTERRTKRERKEAKRGDGRP